MADLPFAPEPGSISPTLALEPTEVFSRPVGFDDDPNLISTGLRPIDPNARAKLDAQDPLAGFKRVPDSFEDAGGARKIDLNARAKLGGFADPLSEFKRVADPLSEFTRVSDFSVRSVEELDKDRKGFDPVSYFAQNPDVSDNPEDLKKLLDVYRKRREEGLTAGGVIKAAVEETPGLVGEIVGGTKKLVERGIDVVIQPTANVVLGTLSGDLFDEQRRDALFNETRKVVRKGVGEISAGSEAATVGLVDLTRTGLRKLPKSELAFPGRFSPPGVTQRELPKPQTDQELLAQISDDASFRQNAEEILTGRGEAAKNFGLDRDTLAKEGITLDEEAIKQLSLVDPITMVATGGAFKLVGIGGKVLGTATTLAGAKKIADKLASVAKFSAGKTVQGVGKAVGGVGTGLRGLGTGASTIAGISSAVSGGGIPQSLIVGGAVKTIGPVLRRVGPVIEHAGKAIAGEVPISANLQRLLDIAVTPAAEVAKTVSGGAAKGVVAASPFAIAADSDEQAGALLGAGASLGAGAAAGEGAFRVVKNSAARRFFGENRPVLEDVPSPGYGRDAALDTQHEAGIQKLSAQNASELNNFREILRSQDGEIYVVDEPTFRQKVADEYRARTGKELTPDQLDWYQEHHALFDETVGDKKVVYLNSDTTGLHHDAGHIFDALLSEETHAKLRTAVKEAFPAKAIADFKKLYENRVGNKISDADALNEFIAEQFSALFNNVPITEMNAPRSLLSKFIDTVAEGAEILGVDIGAGRTTPNLNAPVSVGIRKLFLNAAGEVTRRNVDALPEGPAPTNVTPLPQTPPPAPAGPGAVAPPTNIVPLTPPPANVVPLTPAGRSIRVTPEQVAAFKQQASPEIRAAAAARAAETGVDYARGEAKKAEGSPTSIIIERISDSMESGAPVVGIEHLGITSASTPEAPLGRGGRRPEQAAGYAALEAAQLDVRQNAPPEIVAQHSKNFVPVRWTDQGGTPTLIAMSLDKVISNVLRIAADPKAKDLIPYAVENGKLTPDGWREVVADAQAYSENQANGRKGDGGRLEVPEAGLSIPAENPAYTPQTLSPERANFQNLVQGLAPPQTSRAQPGVMPGNVKGQILAEANRRPVELPANIPAKQAGKQAFVEFPPRVVQEVNPLRNELARRGVNVRDLLEVTERIRAKDIVSATPKPDIAYRAPVTDIIRGGFLPAPTEFRQKNLGGRTVEEFSDYVLRASPEEWKAATDNMTGGLTGGAWNLGLGLKDSADVGVLRSFQDRLSEATKTAMKAGDFDGAYSLVSKGQFFREAFEAATGTGSAGAAFKRGTAGMENAKPPFPIEGSTEAARFQPAEQLEVGTAAEPEIRVIPTPASAGGTPPIEPPTGGPVIPPPVAAGRFQPAEQLEEQPELTVVPASAGGTPPVEPPVGIVIPPPIAAGAFQPRTEAGRKLEERGYEIVASGEMGSRRVTILDRDKEAIAQISSVQRSPQKAEIVLVTKKKGAPAGLGDVLYREVGSQLRDDGVRSLGGQVISPEPLAIRKKVFGGFDKLTINEDPATYKEALDMAERLGRSDELAIIEPVNKITAATRFLPRDAQGRPLDKEGNIDYPKWQAEGIAAVKKQRAEPIEESVPKGEVSVDLGTATGWVLPNKEFVPLDEAFHEQYLANNAADLNKRFNTKFSETSSVDDRLDALNAGFVRLRNQGGAMRVEANAERWPRLKSSVLDTLADREGKIDNLVISLLNRKGKQVDSASAPRLQELSGPEKFDAISEAVNSLRSGGGAFLPAEGGLPGIGVLSKEEQGRAKAARRIATVREENPEAVAPQYARDEGGEVIITPDGNPKPLTLNYNFIDSPLVKEAAKGLKGVKREEAAAVALGDELVKVYREVEKNPDIKAGAKWYSTARTRLKKVFGDDAKLFAELLGATSPRTPVDINYRFALDAYNQLKAGGYDQTIAKYREGKAAWEAQELGDFKGGEDATRGQFLDYWVTKHDLGVTQSNGKKFGMNSRAVLRVLDGSWAAEVKGPKTPNFTGNLTGTTFEATIDIWAGRTLHRLANQGGKARWRILPENETGISDVDFYLGQAAYRDAATKLGIKPDALQAVLWFAEKEYWEKKGWTKSTGAGAAKSDFNVLLAETERAPGGELRMKAPKITKTELDFGAELSDIRRKK